jgi:DNA-binding CsgD family transcriptional regulator
MVTDTQLAAWDKLTRRQRDCIEALRRGHYSNKAIARVVGVDVYTVADHFGKARAILGVNSRIGLALIAERVHHLQVVRDRDARLRCASCLAPLSASAERETENL